MNRVYYLTGAAGWLGSTVLDKLLAQGKTVRALVLPGDPLAKELPDAAQIVEGDVRSWEDMDRFLEAGEQRDRVVIHCAAIISMSMTPVPKVHDVNVNGTRTMVEASLAAGVSRFVYISSVHALPERPHGETIRESTVFTPDRQVGAYAKSKAEATQIVFDAQRERGLPAVVLYPSGICGPGDIAGGHLSQLFIDYFHDRLPAGVAGGYSFSDVRDVADAVIAALDKGRVGEGYIVASHYVTVADILRILHEQSGHRRIKCMLPLWLVRLMLPFITLYYKIKKQPAVFSTYAQYTLSSNGAFSHEKAARELGFTPRPFEDTVRDMIAWLRQEGKI